MLRRRGGLKKASFREEFSDEIKRQYRETGRVMGVGRVKNQKSIENFAVQFLENEGRKNTQSVSIG